MQDITAVWTALDMRRRVIVIAATLSVFAAVLALSRMAATADLSLLYSGLDTRQSGEVIQALEQRGVVYEVRGESIFVDAAQRDSLRMQLATEGLPANSGSGYEILDGLSGFGTTSQMFDAAYWRAKEGELARTILSSPDVRQVRVHIANPIGGPFRRSTESSASVMLSPKGTGITESSADAFRYLVASAVQGLAPENVTIIDSTSGRVIGPGDGEGALTANSGQQAAALKANVERLLLARLGAGNAVVELALEPVTETESIRERRVDPDSRVAISTDVEEIVTSEKNGGGKAVTVASNLPDGEAAAGGQSSESQNSESRTITNFDLSEVTRDVERQAGAIKRLTVAVLLNSSALVRSASGAAEGVPPADILETELSDIRELVAASIGFDESRGDRITVKAMAFEPTVPLGTEAVEQTWLHGLTANSMQLAQLIVLALVTLALALFVVRPILSGARGAPQTTTAGFSMLPSAPDDLRTLDVVSGPEAGQDGTVQPMDRDASPEGAARPMSLELRDGSASAAMSGAPDTSRMSGDPVSQLKSLIEERQPDTLEILRNWLEDDRVEGSV